MSTSLLILCALMLVSLGAEILVRHASLLALRAGISPLLVGLTIVGFGTSSPELGASLTATLGGLDGVSVGNVIGSNIFNIAVILAVTAIICPIRVELAAIRSDIFVAILAAVVPFLSLLSGGYIGRPAGLFLLLILAAYLFHAYRRSKIAPLTDEKKIAAELDDTLALPHPTQATNRSWLYHTFFICVALVLLVYGSTLFVDNAVTLARALGVSELVIGLTIVSVGTSLPELITSIVAALKKNAEIAVGNILGSNIFNSFCILGTCATVKPQAVAYQSIWLDTPVMLVSTVALLPIIRSGGVISRTEGSVLLAGYGVYLTILLSQ